MTTSSSGCLRPRRCWIRSSARCDSGVPVNVDWVVSAPERSVAEITPLTTAATSQAATVRRG